MKHFQNANLSTSHTQVRTHVRPRTHTHTHTHTHTCSHCWKKTIQCLSILNMPLRDLSSLILLLGFSHTHFPSVKRSFLSQKLCIRWSFYLGSTSSPQLYFHNLPLAWITFAYLLNLKGHFHKDTPHSQTKSGFFV